MKLRDITPHQILVAGIIAVFISVSVGGIIVYNQTKTRYMNDMSVVDDEIRRAEQELAKLDEKVRSTDSKKPLDNTGISMEQVQKDKATIEHITKTLTTWSSYEQYETMRNTLMTEYKTLNSESDLMKKYAPYVKNDVIQGKNYNSIDYRKLNTCFVSVKPFLLDVQNGIYSYMTIVEYKVEANDTHARGTSTMLFIFDSRVPGDNLKSVTAYTGDVSVN